MQLGQLRPLVVRDQQLHIAQRPRELHLDPLGQRVDSLARERGDQHRAGVPQRQLPSPLFADPICLGQDQQL